MVFYRLDNRGAKFKDHGIAAIKQVKGGGGKMDKLTWIINSWDPTNLMSHAPAEEYNLEIQMIADLLKKTNDENELAKGIQDIFLNTCGEVFFKKSFEECLDIAKNILK